jgi:hypothetical protein
MRWLSPLAICVSVFIASTCATSAMAASPVPVMFGSSWDGPSNDLQHVIDAYIGIPGALNVQPDFVGARAGQLDPWFWVGNSIQALMITEIAGNANTNELGWYRETGTKPVIDGLDDGIVFSGPQSGGASVVVTFPSGLTKFGFYLNTHHTISTPFGMRPQLFFTNRFYNDLGLNGAGATHAPFDGDVQAIVYDVSPWKGPNTWLVCFEDTDAGAPITPCCSGTDDDYNDMVFIVKALGATPTRTITFGELKTRYR